MQAQRLADTTGLSLELATDAFKRYHRSHPEIKAWWRKTEEEARKSGVLYNLLGRRWVLTEIITETTLESIVAFVPQSTVGDHVVRAIYLIEDDEAWPQDARVALDTHDGLIALAPIDKLEMCARIMTKHMETPLHVPNQPPLIIPAEVKITKTGVSWRLDDNGRVEWYNDPEGMHRWSHLEPL
jgi:DNA polymerase I-like protein with 3'-5' exonuclease and polymerase domains